MLHRAAATPARDLGDLMFDDFNVVDVLTQRLVDPVFALLKGQSWAYWDGLTKDTQLLAAVGIALGAALALAGARLLLFATVLVLATPDIVAFSGQVGDSAAHLTKVLYVVGVLAGALGLVEATLKLVFGRDAGSFAFATVVGTMIGALIPFLPRRR